MVSVVFTILAQMMRNMVAKTTFVSGESHLWASASETGINHARLTLPSNESIYSFTCLLFEKNRGFFCASLLLKMHLGINFFWILGSSSTLSSYESKKVSGRFPDVLPQPLNTTEHSTVFPKTESIIYIKHQLGNRNQERIGTGEAMI